MNKKIVKILSIFLVLISISTMCYAGFEETHYISENVSLSRIQGLLTEVIYKLIFVIFIKYYVLVFVVLYAILNILIIRKKKELIKISIKINIIILLISLLISLLALISEFDLIGNINLYELIVIIIPLLIISLIFQKVLQKKDDNKIKKSNCILKILIVVLLIVDLISFTIVYTVKYLITTFDFKEILSGDISLYEYMYKEIDKSEPILVEVQQEHFRVNEPTHYYSTESYTVSIGDSIGYKKGKVLGIDEEGVLLEYTEIYYEKQKNDKENESSINNFSDWVELTEKKEIKLKWDTWYKVTFNDDPTILSNGDTDIYTRVTKNK